MSNTNDEIPRYRVTRDVHQSPNSRFKLEPPFSQILDNDEWQYADRVYKAREEITTTSWPHPSFRPLNRAAEEVLKFFNSRMKSRLPRSPWRGDRIHLDDGLTGPGRPDVKPPQVQPFNLRPVA
jgi:hypothetical protein